MAVRIEACTFHIVFSWYVCGSEGVHMCCDMLWVWLFSRLGCIGQWL